MAKADSRRKTLKLSVRASRLGIRLRRVKNRSRGEAFGDSWLAIIPSKVTGGRRIRRQFKAGESKAAVNYAEGQAALYKEQGQHAFALTPEQVADAKTALKRLAAVGLTLTEAAAYAATHLRPAGGDRTLAKVRDEMLAKAEETNLRPASVQGLMFHLGKLVEHFGAETLVKSISATQLTDWMKSYSSTGASPRHVHNLVAYSRQFFRFCSKKNYVARDPAANLRDEIPKSDERDIVVLTIPEVKRLLVTAMLPAHRDMMPALVLGLFCGGIRTQEVARLKWSDVNLETKRVTLSGKVTKTREKRTCEIPANALEFLLLHPNRTGPITPPKFRKRLTGFHQDAGFPNWKKTHANAKRHSFGTYASKVHDWEWVVTQMGNSVAMLLKHYRDSTVSPGDAKAYFDLTPANIGKAGEIEAMPAEKGA
jgi:site-specific recombinase XerD